MRDHEKLAAVQGGAYALMYIAGAAAIALLVGDVAWPSGLVFALLAALSGALAVWCNPS